MILYPVCVTEQIGSVVQLHVNSFGHGHDTLCWYKSRDKSRLFHVKLSGADIIISGFKESSEYTFFTINSENRIPSSEHKVYLNCDTPYVHLSKLKNYIAFFDDPEYAEDLVSRISAAIEQQQLSIANDSTVEVGCQFYVTPAASDILMPIEVLQQEWEQVDEPLEYEYSAYAKLYQVLERYYSLKCKSINKSTGIDFSIDGVFSPVLKPGYQITRFDVYAKDGGNWHKERTIRVDSDEIRIGYDFGTVYKVRAFTNSEMVYEFIHYQPDEDMYSYLWNMFAEDKDEVMEADISLDHEDINMTPTEIKWYNEAARLGAADWIAVRPQPSNVADYVLYFFIPSYSLLTAIGKKFYLAAQETDLAFGADFQFLSEITGEYVGVDYADYYLGGDVYFYIVDESFKPVSKVTRFSFDNDIDDYNDKVRQLEVKNYRKRLEDIMRVRFPKAVPEINAYCGVLAGSQIGYTENLWCAMLARINMNQGEWLSRPRVFFGIMEEYLGNFTLDRNFFLDKVTFYHATSIFTFPRIKDRNYVLSVCSFNRYSGSIEEMYYPSFNTSIEIQTTEFDYTIMYAIDKDTYRRSGFIIASREDGYITTYEKDVTVFNDNRLYVKGRG